MIVMWNKKTRTKDKFKSREEFSYFCSNSSVFGRWDFEKYTGQDKKLPKFCHYCGKRLKPDQQVVGYDEFTGKEVIRKVLVCPKLKFWGFVGRNGTIISEVGHSIVRRA